VVNMTEKLKRHQVLKDFTRNPNAPQCYDQLVVKITRKYKPATYFSAVDYHLASTTSTQGDRPVYRFALIDSPSDKLSRDDCLMFVNIVRRVVVTFITINETLMVGDSEIEIEYIITYHLNLEQTIIIGVKQEEVASEHIVIDLLKSSENKISGGEFDIIQEDEKEREEEEERKG